LNNPATNRDDRLTIPAGALFSRAITVEIKSILTFDNVLITSAVDVETGVCYTKLIGKSGEAGTFIDATIEMIGSDEARLTREADHESKASAGFESATPDATFSAKPTETIEVNPRPASDPASTVESDPTQQKYLLCSNRIVLGYSLLEKTRAGHERSGRFFPSDDYFEFSEIFAAFPQAENDCLEANVREAYGLTDDKADEYRKLFYDLTERIEALKLYVANETGDPFPATEVKVEDLSRHYGDESERWLRVHFATRD